MARRGTAQWSGTRRASSPPGHGGMVTMTKQRPPYRPQAASSASGAVRRNHVERRRSAGDQWRRHGLVQRGELHAMPRGDREQIEVRQLLRRDASEFSERRRVRYRDVGWQEPMRGESEEMA